MFKKALHGLARLRMRNWPLSTQIFLLVSLLFVLFIVLQQIVNQYIFGNFYVQRQFSLHRESIFAYAESMHEQDNVYASTYQFVQEHGFSVVLLDEQRQLVPNHLSHIEILVDDGDETLWYRLPSEQHLFQIKDQLTLHHDGDLIVSILVDDQSIVYSTHTDVTHTTQGVVTDLLTPQHMNHHFNTRQHVQAEVISFQEDLIKPRRFSTDSPFVLSWYTQDTDNEKHMVFLIEFPDQKTMMVIVPIQSAQDVATTLTLYTTYVYSLIIIIIFFTALYVSRFIARPIERTSYVANEMANLNFDVKATDKTNRETTKLSNSMNRLAHSLNETIEQLNQQNEELARFSDEQMHQFNVKKQLVSSISHELKTPLSIMQASISAILDGIIETDAVEAELRLVLNEVTLTSSILREIIDIYRLDSHQFVLNTEAIVVNDLVDEVIASLTPVLKQTQKEIRKATSFASVSLHGDPLLMRRVFTNLIVNAIHHSPAESAYIDITLQQDKRNATFTIRNYDTHIPEDDIDHIFEPFYRVDKSGYRVDRTSGSGLGLYLVKDILAKHRFHCEVKNIENGVEFTVIMPKEFLV